MSHLPIKPLSPEAQQMLMEQMYLLMGKQVQSYHRHRHMGNNSSVTIELAQELLASIEYTVNLIDDVYTHTNLEEALLLCQKKLQDKRDKAQSMLQLVNVTVPPWQTECRWDALRDLQHYLECYDYLHLAHKGPENLFYPIPISLPEGIQGIDRCLFYLNILWIENRIMAGFPDDVLEQFWGRLPIDTLNQCEYLLINGIGKAILGNSFDSLVFQPEEHLRLIIILMDAAEADIKAAAQRLRQWLNLKDENADVYIDSVASQLCIWIGDNARNGNLENLFI